MPEQDFTMGGRVVKNMHSYPPLANLPIATADTVIHGRADYFCLLETKEFLKLFNYYTEQKKESSWKVTQRTLQFYSAPKLRLMPRPLLRGGHKGHYLAPDDVTRLFTIQKLKQKYFLPLWLIREILTACPAASWNGIESFHLPTDEFLEILPFIKQLKVRKLSYYQTCKSLASRTFLQKGPWRPPPKDPFESLRHHVLLSLRGLEDWIESEEAKQTFLKMESEKENPEVKQLASKIQDFKKKLLRRG